MGPLSAAAVLIAQRQIDATRFFQRGMALLEAVTPIRCGPADAPTVWNGLRVTPELVLSLNAIVGDADTTVLVGGATAKVEFAGPPGELLLLRTARHEGALPDLSMGGYEGSLVLLWSNPVGEARLAFGRTLADAQHDAPTEIGSTGAPLFDLAWRVTGLHRSRDVQGVRSFVPIARLVHDLEQSACWEEIAAVHRLARTVTAPARPQQEVVEPDLARAVRWSPDSDDEPMSARDRRRALAGRTLADLRHARGGDAATTPEQRAVDRILAGPAVAIETVADDELLPFATAVRWFRGVAPELPDDADLEREISRRRQMGALVAIVGAHFAPRVQEAARLAEWLADRDRRPLVLRGPGGIGKSALLAHFILEHARRIRFAWIDFDRPDVSADEASITRVVDEHLAWQTSPAPLVVVLDSFETAVQTYGYGSLNPALDALASRFDDLAVIVGSRAPVPLLKVQGEPALEWALPGLPTPVVVDWLIGEGIPQDLADDIAVVTNGVPLNMKLARDLLKGKSGEEAREIVDDLPRQLVTGYLYRRILRRLRDDTLREVAQWMMVPRRLVPELLAALLSVGPEEAERLFSALRSELTLLEGDTVLTVRADLRNTLLPLLEAEDGPRVRKIDRAAADFWAQRAASDDNAAADAVYHVLREGDTMRAQGLWRSGAGRYLGGYAMEELPGVSQDWLEARLSHDGVDSATEAALARGELSKAAALRSAASQIGGTLSGRRRERAFEVLAAESNLAPAPVPVPAGQSAVALEAIVLASSRPSIQVRGGTFVLDSPPWKHLDLLRPMLDRAIAATGRVQFEDGTVLGTAASVGPGLFVTTRSVVERFAVGQGLAVKLIDDRRRPIVDLRAEGGDGACDVHAVTRIVLIHPYWDIAIFEAAGPQPGGWLGLAAEAPAPNADVVVVGHPTRNDHEKELQAAIFGHAFGVKRLMPGKYRGRQAEPSYGRTVDAGFDDTSALAPDPGGAVVDPINGTLLGVRFAWVSLVGSRFVPAWELARDPEIARAGVAIHGTPQPNPAWAGAWAATVPARSILLDAYVARSLGDLTRALALLETVPTHDDDVRIDRALLEAACTMPSDSLRAASMLQALIEQTPSDQWPAFDREAAVATRLRLAVDAEAEDRFLALLRLQPGLAVLLERGHFRVIAPPGGELPWRGGWEGLGSAVPTGDGTPTDEASTLARRIVAASDRCLALQGWVAAYAQDLANFSRLFERPTAEVRELAAAYMAFPYEQIRPMTDFLLDKTDLGPHPVLGWTAVVGPLFTMFRGVRGQLPDGVQTPHDLAAVLDARAKTGRLGAYLVEWLRTDSPTAWQAGVLHLTTELPIERLLRRRYSGAVPS